MSPAQMANMSPQMRARMEANTREMASKGTTVKYCMTQADVDRAAPKFPSNIGCHLENTRFTANHFVTDVVCTGRASGRGHIDVSYMSPTYFKGSQTMTMSVNGREVHTDTTMEGRWLSADCGKVKPHQ
jgi:hypothetical protein